MRCINLSIRKATLLRYPVSSIKAINKNRITIFGKNTNTLPTPVMIPSINKSLKIDVGKSPESNTLIQSIPKFIQFCKKLPK
ncbi:MAG: hypothetical protein BWX61_01272 [Bacteroidetes bacterium ADurb.Bin035]|nr:MAG: hypothetical protein BWX61_01272 [Bacteroidetes bacterium ADurb.Bin035]